MDDGSGDRFMPEGQFDLTDDNYVDPRIIGLETHLQTMAEHTSSQRGTMLASHLPQHVEILHREMPVIASGHEEQFGDYDFNTFGNREMIIEAVIPKFKSNPQMIKEAPTYTIIFRDCSDPSNQIIDSYELSQYTVCSNGFGYKNQILNPRLLRVGTKIDKDTPILVSSAHGGYTQDENGILKNGHEYMMGINANVAFATHPAATTDSVVVSRRLANKMSHIAFSKLSVEIRREDIPLNLYGSFEEYFCIPNIGARINQNGILFGLRNSSNETIFDQTAAALQKPIWDSDRLYYGAPGAKVIDVQVYTRYSQIAKCRRERNQVFDQLFNYQEMHYQYYQDVVATYIRLKETGLALSPKFNQLVTRCMELLKTKTTFNGYKLVNRKEKAPIDFMMVEITYAWERHMSIGFKTTGRDGAKGVNTCIMEDADMFIDDYGYQADLYISFESVYNRMNIGQPFEQYIGRACMMMTDRVRNGEYGSSPTEIFNVLMDFTNDIRPLYAELLKLTFDIPEKQEAFIEAVKQDGMRMVISSFSIRDMEKVTLTLYRKWKIDKTCCNFATYIDGQRKALRTKKPVMIGPKYIYLLGKLPHYQLISAEFGHVSQFEMPIKLSNDLKKQSPYSRTPLRLGEDEFAILCMCITPLCAARLMGIHMSSIRAIELLQEGLLTAEKPSALLDINMTTHEIINDSKTATMLTHMFGVAGIGIPTTDSWEDYITFRKEQGREDLI